MGASAMVTRTIEKYGKQALGVALVIMAVIAGCDTRVEPEEPPAVLAEPSAAALIILKEADRADGTSDNVIRKCVSCKLKMEGSPEHTVEFGQYKLQFCTDFCKTAFTKDPEAALESLDDSQGSG